jgi:uncharacterized membrane protein
MEKRYRILRIVAGFYKGLGLLIGGVGILAAVFAIVAVIVGGAQLRQASAMYAQAYPFLQVTGILGLILAILVTLAGVLLAAALTYATGEGISVLMDVEENTRATGILLKQIRQGTSRRQDVSPDA